MSSKGSKASGSTNSPTAVTYTKAAIVLHNYLCTVLLDFLIVKMLVVITLMGGGERITIHQLDWSQCPT